MQLIKHLASEDLYLQMKNMLLNHIWKIGFAKKKHEEILILYHDHVTDEHT